MQIHINPRSGSTGGFFFQLFFQLLFIGAGCFAVGMAYVRYQQGANIQQVYVITGVGGMFILLSLFQAYRAWRGWKRAQHSQRLKQRHAHAPWRVRPEWRSREMVEEGRLNGSMALFAFFWNVIAWPLACWTLYVELPSPDVQWGVLFVLLFPLVGIGLAWMALHGVLHRRTFGATRLTMETMPGRLGRPLRLRLETGVKHDEAPDAGFHVRLSCYRRYIRSTVDSDGDRRRDVKKDLLWRDEKHVRGRTYGNARRMEVPVAFDLPSDPPASTPEKRETRIMWEVDVDADVAGLDFHADFEIPVFEAEDAPPTSRSAPGASDVSRHLMHTDAAALSARNTAS